MLVESLGCNNATTGWYFDLVDLQQFSTALFDYVGKSAKVAVHSSTVQWRWPLRITFSNSHAAELPITCDLLGPSLSVRGEYCYLSTLFDDLVDGGIYIAPMPADIRNAIQDGVAIMKLLRGTALHSRIFSGKWRPIIPEEGEILG